MKQLIIITSAIVTLLFSAVTYTGCKADKCKDVACSVHGTCYDGRCVCAEGWAGTYCTEYRCATDNYGWFKAVNKLASKDSVQVWIDGDKFDILKYGDTSVSLIASSTGNSIIRFVKPNTTTDLVPVVYSKPPTCDTLMLECK